MVERVTFTGFDPYKLTGVSVTDRELGHGSYATILELEYMGLKCAGKKIHEVLLKQGDTSYTVRRFEEECRLLSQVRHPNIVQFLGVYFQQGVRAPILVMEFLPTNLTSCIEQYGILPKEFSYLILHNVALGLFYLHSRTPPIIHRDLSSNNVLLTPNMTAKISDLGVARILNLTPLQASHMTQAPGTPAYMPPEVMVANPKYNTSVDEFSYGILMIHVFSGQWPEPQVGQTRIEADQLIPVTEAERREIFLEIIGKDHPLMDLVHKCINNNPSRRAHTNEIVERLMEMVSQFPSSFANRLEMLRQIESDMEEKRILREDREAAVLEMSKQMLSLKEANRKSDEINQLNASEVEQVKFGDLNTFPGEKGGAKGAENRAKTSDSQSDTEKVKKMSIRSLMESNHYLKSEMSGLQSKISELMANISSLQHINSNLESDISRKNETIIGNSAKLESCSRHLQEKDIIIAEMKDQLSRVRDNLTKRKEVSDRIVILNRRGRWTGNTY